MKELQIKIRLIEEDVCYYPDDFQKIRFCGLQTSRGERYFRSNWADSIDNYKFWYPFVGGKDASVFTTIRSAVDIIRLYDAGCSFFSFGSAEELYTWMARRNL